MPQWLTPINLQQFNIDPTGRFHDYRGKFLVMKKRRGIQKLQRPLFALSRGSPQVPIADIGNARKTGHFGAQRKIVPSACAC